MRSRNAGAAVRHRPAGDVPALAGHDVHVLAVGADVARGDVAAAQRLDEPAVRAQQRLGLVPARVADDHRLPAPEVEPGQGVLVRHGAGEVEGVSQGRVLAGVGIEPGPAQRRAQGGRIDGDDGPQAGPGVLAEHDLLVPALAGGAPGRRGRLPGMPGIVGHPLIPRGGALTAALREVREDVCHGGDPFPVR